MSSRRKSPIEWKLSSIFIHFAKGGFTIERTCVTTNGKWWGLHARKRSLEFFRSLWSCSPYSSMDSYLSWTHVYSICISMYSRIIHSCALVFVPIDFNQTLVAIAKALRNLPPNSGCISWATCQWQALQASARCVHWQKPLSEIFMSLNASLTLFSCLLFQLQVTFARYTVFLVLALVPIPSCSRTLLQQLVFLPSLFCWLRPADVAILLLPQNNPSSSSNVANRSVNGKPRLVSTQNPRTWNVRGSCTKVGHLRGQCSLSHSLHFEM